MSQNTSKDADLVVAGVTVGHLKDVSYGFTPRPITEYDISGGDPDLNEPGEIEYSVSASWGYVSDAIRTAIKNTKVVLVVGPRGIVAGRPRATLTDCILSFETRTERNRIIMVNINGNYRTETIDTYP